MTRRDGGEHLRATALGGRAYGGADAGEPWDGARRGAGITGWRCLGPCAASGGAGADAGAGGARGARRRGVACSGPICFTGTVFEIQLLQNFV
jgi:hypothetical protein